MINPEMQKLMDEAFKNSTPRPVYQSIFNMADRYNQTAEMALARITLSQDADFVAPAIMCRSFAIELLLKFFLVFEHPNIRDTSELKGKVDLYGHPYSILFGRINAEHQAKIARKFSEIAELTTSPEEFKKHLISLGDKPFVDFRYVYEGGGNKYLNLELLSKISNALGLAAQHLVRSARNKA